MLGLLDGVIDFNLRPIDVDEILVLLDALLEAAGGYLNARSLGGLDVELVAVRNLGIALPYEGSLAVGEDEREVFRNRRQQLLYRIERVSVVIDRCAGNPWSDIGLKSDAEDARWKFL